MWRRRVFGDIRRFKRSFSYTRSASNPARPSRSLIFASAVVLSSGVVWYSRSNTVYNDAVAVSSASMERTTLPVSTEADSTAVELSTFVWGSNRANILSPSNAHTATFRVPSVANWLKGVALRDLAAHDGHAACVDARGDVHQWGAGFIGAVSSAEERGPRLTLRGKNVVQVQPSANKVFALSTSGRVYVLPADSVESARRESDALSSSSWWGTGWFWRSVAGGGAERCVEVTPNVPLFWGEKFVSISAGDDHLLALTSKGRAFAHPIGRDANAYGQLAMQKIRVARPSPEKTRLLEEVELIPKVVADPYARSTPYARQQPAAAGDGVVNANDAADIESCDTLFEVPSLRGVKVARIAAGARTSFALTNEGRVLGWGANEYGQIGLGSGVRLDAITVPTEVVLGPRGTRCLNIYAGGDLTCFSVEQKNDGTTPIADVMFCGNGQWGGLGNNVFSNAQSQPIRAKAVSGLLCYNEATRRAEAIPPHDISISPHGHVLLTLDTLASDTGGRDLVVWGSNQDYQLGIGKRGSIASPTWLHRLDGSRFMLGRKKAALVRDLAGKEWKRGVEVEQRAVALRGSSVVYWRIIP